MKKRLVSLRRTQNGFTLIELLVVMSILAVLAAVVVPTVTGMKTGGETAAAKTDAKELDNTISTFNSNSRSQAFPESSITCTTGTGVYTMTIVNTALPGNPSKSVTVGETGQITTAIASALGFVCPSGGGTMTSHTQVNLDASTEVRQADGKTKTQYMIPDFLTSVPKSAMWVRGSSLETSPDEYLWLLKKGTDANGQGRTLQVLRLSQASSNAYEIARD